MSSRAARVAIVLVALAAVALVALEGLGHALSGRAGDLASEQLGRAVSVEEVELRLRPGLRIRLEGIRISSGFQAAAVEIDPSVVALLRGKLRIEGVRVEETRMVLRRGKDGRIRVGGLGPDPSDLGGDADAFAWPPRIEIERSLLMWVDESRGSSPLNGHLAVHRLVLRDLREGASPRFEVHGATGAHGVFHLRGSLGALGGGLDLAGRSFDIELVTDGLDPAPIVPFLPESWLVRDASGKLDATVRLEGSVGGDFRGDLDLAFLPGMLQFSGIRFEGSSRFRTALRREAGQTSFAGGSARSESADIWGLPVQELGGSFDYRQRTLVLEDVAARLYGGAGQARGRIHFESDAAPVFEAELAVTEIEASGVAGGEPDAGEPMLVDASGSFEGEIVGAGDWLAPIRGSGRLEARGGRVPAAALLSRVAKLLPGFRVAERQTTALNALSATFVVADGRARSHDVSVRTDDYDVRGRASMAHDLSLAGVLEVELRMRGVPAVPIALTGDLREPGFSADLSRVPLVPVKAVTSGLGGIVNGAAGAARGLADGVRDKAR